MAAHDRSVTAGLAALVLAAGVLAAGWTFARISSVRGPFEWDEGGYVLKSHLVARAVRGSDLAAAGRAAAADPNYPPLHALLLAVPFLALGESESVALGFSAVALALTALGLWAAAREAGGLGAAAIAVILLLGSRLHLEYSATALLEAPGTALTLLGAWLYLRHLRLRGAASAWLAGSALVLVFFYKYNFGLFLAAAVLGHEALRRPWRPLAANTRGLWLPLAVSGTTWFLVPGTLGGFLAFAGNRDSGLDPATAALFYPKALITSYAAWWPAGLVALAGAVGSLVLWKREPIRFAALLLGVGLVAMAIHPYKLERSIVTVTPALWILCGAFWEWLLLRVRSPRIRLGLATALALVLVLPLPPLYARDLPALARGIAAGDPPAWSRVAWPDPELTRATRLVLDSIDPGSPVYLAGEFDQLPPTTLRWKLALRHPGTRVHDRSFMGGAPWSFPANVVTFEVLPGSRYFDQDYRDQNAWALEPIHALESTGASPFAEETFTRSRVRVKVYRLAAPPRPEEE